MQGVAKAKHRIDVGGSSAPLPQPLAGLAELRDRFPVGPTTKPAELAPASTDTATTPFSRAKKLVVRRERKGHAGKTATRIEGLVGSANELDAAVRGIRHALGCGAALEGSHVVVQGDQGDRLVTYLKSRGAQKIVVGN